MSLGQEAERVERATDGRLTVNNDRDAAKELKHTADIVTVPVQRMNMPARHTQFGGRPTVVRRRLGLKRTVLNDRSHHADEWQRKFQE
jgi:hypothetical protein